MTTHAKNTAALANDINTTLNTLVNGGGEIRIREETTRTGVNASGGGFGCKGFAANIAENTNWNDLITFSLPYPASLLDAFTHIPAANDGDQLEFLVAPDTVIGALDADEASGQTVLSVGQTVIDNISIGAFVKVDDGTNSDDCGQVVSVDTTAGTITVETALTNSFAAATPSYIKMTRKMAETIELVGGQNLQVGFGSVGGSYVPANTDITVTYKSSDGAAGKRLSFVMEFLR